MNNKDLIANIKKATTKKNSNFTQKIKFRIENRKWLDYSSNIAYRILACIEDNPELTQTAIAKSLNKTRQHINKILKGEQNLTLKTIGDLSDILGYELISFPPYKDTYTFLNTQIISDDLKSEMPILRAIKPEKIVSANYTISSTQTKYLSVVK